MPPYTTSQRAAIQEFVNFTKADKSTAAKFCKANDWNSQSAINAYFNEAPNMAGSGARTDLGKLFDKYRDNPKESPNSIGMEGTQRYCQDIGVSVEDVSFFILSEIVQSTSMGEIERDGFVDGWGLLNAPTTDRQSTAIKVRTSEISTPSSRDILKRVYRHTFKLFLQPPARSLDIETAIALWTVLFSPQALHWQSPANAETGAPETDWFELWTEFLRTKSKRPVNKDVWDQTLVFAEKVLEEGGVGFWSEDGAWPGVVDEFVEWVKQEKPYLDPEKNTDEMEVE
ncbi:hypothetical protein NA57DRAFT_71141 [Rhizodiscina lignyota]|uniref:Defective in cullin neddylation protein n=1 Tax=Rhizodiscina lignyota TaxID=1504668 RepID=A0A9P4IV09_9PEZI|nr:hypothetical protein NA57DRAFT_71141 [Rhizodiscina lignyota]